MTSTKYVRINDQDIGLMNELLDCFGHAFDEKEVYCENRPDVEYTQSLLNESTFIAMVALYENKVVGGLVAYELKKFEQKRSEVYLYDLAVSQPYRRKGVATGLIESLTVIAKEKGAWVVFVQADYIDDPAIQLYTKLGKREDVIHFDIPVKLI